jgi:hypothetical protein
MKKAAIFLGGGVVIPSALYSHLPAETLVYSDGKREINKKYTILVDRYP